MSSSSAVPRTQRGRPLNANSVRENDDHRNALHPANSISIRGSPVINETESSPESYRRDDNAVVRRSQTHRHQGGREAKSKAFVDLSNKTLAPEHTDYMVQALERKPDPQFKRSYKNGVPLEEIVNWAPILTVGLKFLPGADKPQVNRTEEMGMVGKEPDQKDAAWRVTTAGSLLSHFTISPDLQIVQTDQTPKIVRRAKYMAPKHDRRFSDDKKALVPQKQYLDTVTIDSEHVTVVKDLRNGNWDLRGLLVEVDWSSLWDLMVNYRNLIAKGGPEMTHEETMTLLETMIEDARRLCIRSPVLFRMSTRVSIINSENTRYGINLGSNFRTLITSQGIREIISLSASYYNSLDPIGTDNRVQKFIKPRFLQMIVLLLSLLNNEDLAEIKVFLEATYKLKADRRDVELLILKVVPLLSINPRVFLNALVPAIDNFPLAKDQADKEEEHSNIWNIFVKRILEDGYLLPGQIEDLGRKRCSWIVKWPEHGFKSTVVFNTLQYSGRFRTINDIPPVVVNPGADSSELTVEMTDESKYVIDPKDLENIVYMTPGVYIVQETTRRRRVLDLLITETLLSSELYQAIEINNDIVAQFNAWQAAKSRGTNNRLRTLFGKGSEHQFFLKDIQGTGRLVKVIATLGRTKLAVTYKVDGRRISRIDAIQNMTRDIRQLLTSLSLIEQRRDLGDKYFLSEEKRVLKNMLDSAKEQINLANERRKSTDLDKDYSNEPIAKCLYPEGAKFNDKDVWNSYEAWCHENDGSLEVQAKNATVSAVNWLTGELIELTFSSFPFKVLATPLRPVQEGEQPDEVQVGDVASFLGHYVAIGMHKERMHSRDEVPTMANYLRIVDMHQPNQSRRWRNQAEESDHLTIQRFK